MNRILFEPDELKGDTVILSGARAAHILTVLHGEVGQSLKVGMIDGLAGTGVVTAIEPGATPQASRLAVKVSLIAPSPRPWIDLILAPPRPRVLKRLLPQLATLGVGTIVLVGAKKVEKDFWGATLLKEEIYRPLLVEGLVQAGTTILPRIEVRRNMRSFLSDELETMFPTELRLIAHPGGKGTCREMKPAGARPLLAVGPEGGWTDEEVARFEARGFSRYSLGERILRTDTALIALLAQLQLLTSN